jgi:hypothetical protein
MVIRVRQREILRDESVSAIKFFTCLGFATWVSVCAAAPEFIWQGSLVLFGHFSFQTVWSIALIGLILTVFVEPILERARDGRWRPERPRTRNLLVAAPVALALGIAAVSLHECMTAYLAAASGVHGAAPEGIERAVRLILEWACIPLAVTMAWFSARLGGWFRYAAGGAAAVWVIAASWYYNWPLPVIVIATIPCIALIPLGQIYLAKRWNEDTFQNLAIGLVGFGILWLALTLLLQALLPSMVVAGVISYGPGEIGENFRFYLGWALGLALAPNPVNGKRNG